MIRYAVALLSLSCLFASSALAQDDLLARAKQQFEPIPTAPPELPGNVATPGKVELGDRLLRICKSDGVRPTRESLGEQVAIARNALQLLGHMRLGRRHLDRVGHRPAGLLFEVL